MEMVVICCQSFITRKSDGSDILWFKSIRLPTVTIYRPTELRFLPVKSSTPKNVFTARRFHLQTHFALFFRWDASNSMVFHSFLSHLCITGVSQIPYFLKKILNNLSANVDKVLISLQKCCVIHALKMIQKLSSQQWTLNTLNQHHTVDPAC